MTKKTITEIINDDYKNYSIEVIKNRAIPHLIDGFKPVQRKIFYILDKKGKDFIKVAGIAGYIISEAEYHHGDMSAASAATKMGQDFCCSGNNIPWMLRKGSFGSRLIKEAASPRYIYGKRNPLLKDIYIDNDIMIENKDSECPEPEYYLPLIPMILVNSCQGTAVGFSTSIPSHNPKDIIDYMIKNLNNRKTDIIKPYFKGWDGNIEFIEDKYVMFGKFERKSKLKIIINELPPKYDMLKYISVLNKLLDNDTIKSYENNCSGDEFKFNIKLKKQMTDEQIYKKFMLMQNINYNIVTIYDDKVLVFENIYDLIDKFMNIRLEFYNKRYDKLIMDTIEENIYLNKKYKFIKNIISKIEIGQELNEFLLDDVINQIENCPKEFKNIPIKFFTLESLQEIETRINNNSNNIANYLNVDIKKQYVNELKNLRGIIKCQN